MAFGFALVANVLAACDDPREPLVESIQLSADSAAIYFREPLAVSAIPRGHLGVLVARTVNWTSRSPNVVSVVPTTPDGSEAQVRATGVGTAVVDATAGNVSRSLTVTVLDTAYSVSVTPGTAQLTVGDTITLSAVVAGPPTVDPRVRWTGSAVVLLTSPDSASVRIQVTGTSASVIARARADSTKSATPTLTTSAATLAFEQQPGSVAKGSPFAPVVQVAVRNATGTTSTRSVSVVTLAIPNDGSCAPGARLSGRSSTAAIGGIATFNQLTIDRTAAACKLSASAFPPAATATSGAFPVTARGCAPITYTTGDTIYGTIEAGDCTITRAGGTYYSHRFAVTNSGVTNQTLRLQYTGAYAPRIESALWAPDSATWADSADAAGTVEHLWVVGSGTRRFTLSSVLPQATGEYTLTSTVGLGNGCTVLTTRGLTIQSGFQCPYSFGSRVGGSTARKFVVRLPAGDSTIVTLNATDAADVYLEVWDVTGTRSLIGFDDNSGGGTNSRLTIRPAAESRWVEMVATWLTTSSPSPGPGGYRITIP